MIKNIYLRCALVLGAICVSSAVLIGGLNTITESYREANRVDVPEEIQMLKSDGTFERVTLDAPINDSDGRITIEEIYALKDGETVKGYAYNVTCQKPVKTDVTFTVLFEGPATTASTVKPSAINITCGGDATYDVNITKLANNITKGSSTMNDQSGVMKTGGTKSQEALLDALRFVRDEYVSRINGGGQTEEKTTLQEIYGDRYKSEVEDTTFAAITATTDNCSYEITNRYLVTLKDATVTKAYAGTTSFTDPEEGGTNKVAVVAAFSGDKTTVKVDGYKFTKNTSYNNYKAWMEGVATGTTSLDDETAVSTGSTFSTKAVRDMLLAMRDDYIANYKSEAAKLYGDKFVSEEADEFATIAKTTDHCSLEITKRTSVVLTDGTGKAYEGTTSFTDPVEGGTNKVTLIVAFSGDKTNVVLNGYKVLKNTSYADYKKWLDGVSAGTTNFDDETAVTTSSTFTTNAVRDMALEMRADYIASLGE